MPASCVETNEPLTGNYFVAAYPPFTCWRASQLPAVKEALNKYATREPLGLYIHIPFCQKKCDYCYYLSYTARPAQEVEAYIDCVVQELKLYSKLPGVCGRPVSFVYFGGGTPSLLTADQLRRMCAGLRSSLPWDGVREVTFECAPRSVRKSLLAAMREVGVSRVSMGVQSFDDNVLRANGRIHLGCDTERAFGLIRESGFDWVNLDLMAGLPGEEMDSFQESVRRAIALSPESVTVYQTEMPYNTQLCREFHEGCLPTQPPSWAEKRERLYNAFLSLETAGYTLKSAYHAVKDPARHNFVYQDEIWHGADMLGLGVASFSYLGGVHFQNLEPLAAYCAAIQREKLPLQRARLLNSEERLVREFILQLKQGKVEAASFLKKFNVDILERFAAPLRELALNGWLTFSSRGVELTRAGLLRVDRLLSSFYQPEHSGVRYS